MKNSSFEAWQKKAEAEVDKPLSGRTSPGGLKYSPAYFSGDVQAEESVPGSYPFTRGPRASMYQGRPWTLRQYAGFSTAEESNEFYQNCLAQGQRGLSVAFDLPTHRGYDSDHQRARGDVGKAGVAIDSVEDMALLFKDIPLDKVSVSMTMNGAVLPIMAAYIVVAEEQGVAPAELKGTVQNDILKEFLVRNTYIYPPTPSIRIVGDVIAHTSEHMPRFNPISISGYHLQEAGASEDLELAFTLANGLEYVKKAVERGLPVDKFAPRLSFFFGVGMDLFLEVAKLRAARFLWAKLMKERFSPQDPNSMRLRMHCQTSGVSLTAQQPLNNVVRTTVEALAAVLGGTQSLHTNAYDEALALPTEDSARVARSTQLILQEETDVTNSVDPLAGCYLVEDLTQQLAARAEVLIQEVEAAGGMTRAIEEGIAQSRIARSAAERQLQLDKGERRLIGVNCYESKESAPLEVRLVDDETVMKAQLKRLEDLRNNRDASRVDKCLDALREAAKGQEVNLLARSIECMRARATLGEVSLVLEEVYGRHQARASVVGGVYAGGMTDDAKWKVLRARIEAFSEKNGRRPRILIAKVGQDGHDRGAKVVASGFADAGFDVDLGPLFQAPAEVAQASVDSDVHVVGISSQAGGHRLLVPDLLRELKERGAENILVVCGGIIPSSDHEELKRVGVAAIFSPGTRIDEAATQIMDVLENHE